MAGAGAPGGGGASAAKALTPTVANMATTSTVSKRFMISSFKSLIRSAAVTLTGHTTNKLT